MYARYNGRIFSKWVTDQISRWSSFWGACLNLFNSYQYRRVYSGSTSHDIMSFWLRWTVQVKCSPWSSYDDTLIFTWVFISKLLPRNIYDNELHTTKFYVTDSRLVLCVTGTRQKRYCVWRQKDSTFISWDRAIIGWWGKCQEPPSRESHTRFV